MSRKSDIELLVEQAKEAIINNEGWTDNATKELMHLYDEAAYQVNNRIDALVGRYAEQNGLTHEMANQFLSGKEYNTWQHSLEKYIDKISEAGHGSKLEFELNTLAMKSRISREEQLLGDIYKNLADLAGDGGAGLRNSLADIYRMNYKQGMFNIQKNMGLGFNIAKVDERQLRRILNYPWQTKTFSKSIWDKTDLLAVNLKRELTLGFMNGSSVQYMAKQINDVFNAGRYNAMRLVRTECKYFANQGELAGYKENGIDEYKFIGGSEGSGNCDCASMDGQVFKVEDAVVGVNYPPMHPHCLCIVVAAFRKSMFEKRSDAVPLSKNEDFERWAKKFAA